MTKKTNRERDHRSLLISAKKKAREINSNSRMANHERGYKSRLISKEDEDKLYNGRRYEDYK